jgi:hypothetical protein
MLRYTILLSIEEKSPMFLTIENYIDIEELLWQYNYYNYVHEGYRGCWAAPHQLMPHLRRFVAI